MEIIYIITGWAQVILTGMWPSSLTSRARVQKIQDLHLYICNYLSSIRTIQIRQHTWKKSWFFFLLWTHLFPKVSLLNLVCIMLGLFCAHTCVCLFSSCICGNVLFILLTFFLHFSGNIYKSLIWICFKLYSDCYEQWYNRHSYS
jgi:hypothetical protein